MPRSRLPLLVLVLAIGLAVLAPDGVGAHQKPRSSQAGLVRCSDARGLATLERRAVRGELGGAARARRYRARLDKLVGDACKPRKDCRDQTRNVAALVEVRRGRLDASKEAGLVAAETGFLRKHCSS